jgi:hypothetical protein
MLLTLRHSNPVRDEEQKSLRFGGDMKSNPVCIPVLNRFWRVCFNIVAFIFSLLQYVI